MIQDSHCQRLYTIMSALRRVSSNRQQFPRCFEDEAMAKTANHAYQVCRCSRIAKPLLKLDKRETHFALVMQSWRASDMKAMLTQVNCAWSCAKVVLDNIMLCLQATGETSRQLLLLAMPQQKICAGCKSVMQLLSRKIASHGLCLLPASLEI